MDAGSDVSQRILRAARELLFSRGFSNTPLRVIATEAGTSESGVLRIYGSKIGLLRAVYSSCWAQINSRVDAALVAAAEKDPDPRNLLIELMRAIWQGFHDDLQMSTFMISHYGYRETAGLSGVEGIDPSVDERLKEEYHRYLNRIHELCEEVIRSRPELTEAGVTSAALGHIVISITHGIQTSWYMARSEGDTTQPQVTMDEALAVAKFFLYPEASDR